MRNWKKMAAAGLAVGLVATISIAGTLAYLTAGESGDKKVTNTFVAAGGGNLIDPDPEKPDPDPDLPGEWKGFYLGEHEYQTADNSLGAAWTASNTYEKLAPNMELPKDPTLFIDIADGVDAYVFIKVEDTTQGNLISAVDTTKWTKVAGKDNIYYLSEGSVNGVHTGGRGTGNTITASILTGGEGKNADGQVAVKNATGTDGADPFKDVDATADGLQLGKLEFTAYACQAEGFETPAAAFEACFPNVN